jgi:hypothetical protein
MRLAWIFLFGAASAQAGSLRMTPADVAGGFLPTIDADLPDAGVVDVEVDYGDGAPAQPCRARLTQDGLYRTSDADCPAIWAIPNPSTAALDGAPGTYAVEIRGAGLDELVAVPVDLAAIRDDVDPAELGAEHAVVWEPPGRWAVVPTTRLEAGAAGYAETEDGWIRFGTSFTADTARTSLVAPANASTGQPPLAPFCPRSRQRDEVVVCWDLTTGEQSTNALSGRVRPNATWVVSVRHAAGTWVDLSVSGDVGVYTPSIRPSELGSRDVPEGGRAPVVTTRRFAPRLPGPVVVAVALDGEVAATSEFVVEETFAGALRTGVALVGGGALDGGWASALRPGSGQAEVVATTHGSVNAEVFVGVAPYLERGGRPADGCRRAPFCFGPLIGLGVLTVDGGSAEFLKSVHLGAEWEPSRTFSVGFTGVARRVDRLPAGLRVGSPTNGDPVTTTGYGLGFGVVLGFTPDVFRLASQGVY